jgi:predicted RNase H-like HicB family nuclease
MPLDSWLREPGETKEEALENIRDAIKLCLEVRAERGLPLMIESCQVEVAI